VSHAAVDPLQSGDEIVEQMVALESLELAHSLGKPQRTSKAVTKVVNVSLVEGQIADQKVIEINQIRYDVEEKQIIALMLFILKQ
jgi:hypothetical protein